MQVQAVTTPITDWASTTNDHWKANTSSYKYDQWQARSVIRHVRSVIKQVRSVVRQFRSVTTPIKDKASVIRDKHRTISYNKYDQWKRKYFMVHQILQNSVKTFLLVCMLFSLIYCIIMTCQYVIVWFITGSPIAKWLSSLHVCCRFEPSRGKILLYDEGLQLPYERLLKNILGP